MKKSNDRLYLSLAIVGLFAAVALARFDLFMGALQATLAGMSRGPRAQLHLLFEIVLFSAIMLFTLWAVPARFNARRDGLIIAAAAAAGFLAEAWGTRTGLWTYYTHEAPPLWIVPVWPLGALVIDRMTEKTQTLLAGRRIAGGGYWTLAAAALTLCVCFSWPAADRPATWAVWAALAAALFCKARPERDVWLLLTGMFYVFFADLWGTTNNCWSYYLVYEHHSFARVLTGVGFGMLFDATVILAALKISRGL